jgi:glycosyltransferase involved in cell wall biosynthesis
VAAKLRLMLPSARLRVIPFLTADEDPVPPAKCVRDGRRVLNVAYFGRLVAQKRPDRLVAEWSRLAATPPVAPARLDLYGFDPTGEIHQRIRSHIHKGQLQDRVHFHGEYRRADLPYLLRDKDLVVLPSEWEGLPLILVEAMQNGVPFVATSAGGTAELATDNPDVVVTSTAWTAFEGGFIDMCQRLRNGTVNRERMYGWVTERYGYEAVSRQWLDMLSDPNHYFVTDAKSPAHANC